MAVYDPAALGVTPPEGGFQKGAWYQGRQYWNGSLSDPGTIHPSSDQMGAGQPVSQETRRQSAVAQGVPTQQFLQYSKPPEPVSFANLFQSQLGGYGQYDPFGVGGYLPSAENGEVQAAEAARVRTPEGYETFVNMSQPQGVTFSSDEFVAETPDWVKPTIQRYAEAYGVPAKLLSALLHHESGFNPNATSYAGAQGIAQFIPSTAAAYNVDVFDPESSIRGSAQFLSDLYKQHGSWERALSAYNSGRPDSYLDPNFAEGQTYRYVRNIMGRM